METKSSNVLDSGVHGDVDLKRRITYNDVSYITGFDISNDLKLKLGIEISGPNIFNLKECTGESNDIDAHVRVFHNRAEIKLDVKDNTSSMQNNVHVVKEFEENKRIVEDVPKKNVAKEDCLDVDSVKEMFSRSIGSLVGGKIVALHCGSGYLAKGRRELFKKQMEIIKRLQGDADIHYAWLTSPKGSIYSAMNYGLGCHMSSNIMSNHEIGVHLIPINCTSTRETLFDVDENWMGCLLLCSVLTKNMEHVHQASNHFHPSTDDYDCGVDNLQNPKHYIVWSMNINTHIYPEYFISFKISCDPKGLLNENRTEVPQVTNFSKVRQAHVQLDSHSCDLGGNNYQVCIEKTRENSSSHLVCHPVRVPKSLWIHFHVLIDSISSKLSAKDMQLVSFHFELFQNKLISRGEFIMWLRIIVGDTLLRSTIASLQNKIPLQSGMRLGNAKRT